MSFLKIYILALFIFLSNLLCRAQTVETVAGPSPRLNNGITVHRNGDVYASDFFGIGFNGNSVYRISPDGTSTLYASGLSQPAGLAFNLNDVLYVAEFAGNKVSSINAQGVITQFASGLDQPADLVFDSDTNLYVSNFGNGTISKITPSGSVITFVTGLDQPVGLAIDENDFLYSANLINGKIFKINSSGNKDLLTIIPDLPIGFMTYSLGNLFVTSTGGHKVYKIELIGNTVSVYAGNGLSGTVNGNLSFAQFTNPDGIAANSKGDTLYVSENNTNLLRRICVKDFLSIPDYHYQAYKVSLFPNPAVNFTTISYQINSDQFVKLELYCENGLFLKDLFSSYLEKGKHEFKMETNTFSSGIYLCKISSNDFSRMIKLLIN